MLRFDHHQPLAPEEVAGLAGASLPLLRRLIAAGCPTTDGRIAYATFVDWAEAHVARALPEYALKGFPVKGFFSEASQFWVVRPVAEWALHEADGWLDVGGPGVDGISWALRRGDDGVFARYPIGAAFVWKAADASALVSGWESGDITV